MSEEGEVSEGELEDVYEPRDAEIIADLSYIHRDTGNSTGFSKANGRQVADDPSAVFSAGMLLYYVLISSPLLTKH